MVLTRKDKLKLIDFMWEIGFIINETPILELKTNKEKCERIKTLVNQGFRVQVFRKDKTVINIKGELVTSELEKEVLEAYDYLTKEAYNKKENVGE